jgi:pimeloyl-ACP methyl ester carboxylesterase
MDDLGEDKAHLIGHDWGAGVAYTAGALAPERFHSITTIAVPHAARLPEGIRQVPSQLAKSWYMMFFQLRGVAEYVVERKDWSLDSGLDEGSLRLFASLTADFSIIDVGIACSSPFVLRPSG